MPEINAIYKNTIVLANAQIAVGDVVEATVNEVARFGLFAYVISDGKKINAFIDIIDIPRDSSGFKLNDKVKSVVLGIDPPNQIRLSLLPQFFSLKERWSMYKKQTEIGDVLRVDRIVRSHNHILLWGPGCPFWAELNEEFKNYTLLSALKKQVDEGNVVAKIIAFNDATCRPIVSLTRTGSTI